MTVLVLHTLPPQEPGAGRYAEEFDLTATAEAIAEALPHAIVAGIRGEAGELSGALGAYAPDVVFNLCEAPLGRPELEPQAAALFEWLGVAFTGSGSEALAICRRKDRTGAILTSAGVRVPRTGAFPCIVKPVAEDASAGISARSVCETPEEALLAAARWDGPVIVEEFLPGREFVVSLWGDDAQGLSIGETVFENGVRVNTYDAKWDPGSFDYINSPLIYDPPLDGELRDRILRSARRAWSALDLYGYARIDLRLDECGAAAVIDVNPNPCLWPGAGMHRAITESGCPFDAFVRGQVELALARQRRNQWNCRS